MEGLAVGRIVHYIAYGTPNGEYPAGAHRAAIITEVLHAKDSEEYSQQWVNLAVFNPTGIHWNKARYSEPEHGEAGTWHWPEKS